ncbi:peptide methionine sulfoxide reductase [Flavobacterium akiainvivens]|uniref:peptide-methionine (S)-S-oxide reductase n=1 Tax=Flavobacterium akiainvivens TaxID=1202724 RepID=A0A0M9VHF5_9FLAO|nr:peptide-methionine (S)-S-oxide reductase [Flavobacterium akiainvivens]KOS05510.1 peptide methionine sulfoxide reductase [Flavobacterium akiainvivens]SFQ33359.1 peptide-methionine (S)-S-oxide reductase [Flavobacterium akiainvivens]
MVKKAGFGGGCHWCTEAVFASLKGIHAVEQGWIASTGQNSAFSEAVVVTYDSTIIDFENLIAIHLYTHSSTSQHSMRGKYRSAIYTFTDADTQPAINALNALAADFDAPVITQVLPFAAFEKSREALLDYYYTNPEKPFCELYINPKLQVLMQRFKGAVNRDKLQHLNRADAQPL